MHALFIAGLVAVTLGAAGALAGVGPVHDVDAAMDEYPRRIGIDIENYRFALTLRDDSDVIEGRATVSVRFTKAGITELLLDLVGANGEGRGMTVTSVELAGRPLDFTHELDLLRISLLDVAQVGATLNVTVSYYGVPVSGLHAGPNKHGDRTFFSDNWPNRARNWLPTIDHPYDKAMSEMVVTAPAHYQVVSNGLLVEETDGADGTRVTHWKQSVPIATWLYVLGVAEFAVQHVDDFRGLPIQTWVYRQDRDEGFYDFAVPTKQVMEFYADHVGPYAYERLANITSPVTGGGMEAATAIMYHENSVTGDRTVRWRNVIIHEIAHQWFGNAVTESDWDDVWLSEGFATYFTLLFIEHAYGRDEFVDGLQSSAGRVFTQYESNPSYRIVHDDLDDMSRVSSGATYQKGSWILHMLRGRMGDETFWAGIRAYYARYMNQNATTSDFQAAMEEASGLDLQTFFDQWLRHGGNPKLQGWWNYDASAGAVRIELSQTQTVGPMFEMPLEIGIYHGGQVLPTTIERVDVDGGFHRFVILVDVEPTDVRLDPNSWTLFEADFGRQGR